VVLGGVGIFIRFGHRVDPYFHLLMPDPPDGWWKVWFLLRNDTDVVLPVFKGSHPIPQPNWGYGVDRIDLHRLQPLHEVVQQLWRMGADGCGPPADLFQPLCLTALSAANALVDVSGAKLP
jgi:hypothetical protein